MTKQSFIRAALVLTCLFAASAQAQEATRMQSEHAITLDAGFESAFITRLGYSHRAEWLGEDSRIYARFALPVASPDLGDFAIDGGVRLHAIESDDWGVQLLAGPLMRHAENELFAATALGVRAVALPGYQSERWGLMLDIGLEQMLTTRIEHSDLYERTFYSNAKSGWYALSSGTIHAGLRGGVRLGKLELSATAGVMSDTELQPLMPPFYATLATSYAL